MNEKIFREKSLERFKSPDNLDEYIKVSKPSIWLFMISVIVLLIGVCVWGVFGYIDSTVPTTVYVKDGAVTCYIDGENISSVHEGLDVKFEDFQTQIESIGEKSSKGYSFNLTYNKDFVDGVYEGKVVTKRQKPMSFIIN